MKKQLTTAKIAKKLHLSQPTVSRALNPARAWMVNIHTREKIRNFCLKSGALSSTDAIRSKNARAAFVLGDMESDLFYLRNLIGSLTVQLQNCGCSLSMIRVDDTPGKLARNVKRVISSDIADIFIINPSFLIALNPEFLHQVCSRLVLMTPFLGQNGWITGRKWLSGIYFDYEAPHRKVIMQLPDELLTDMVFFGPPCNHIERHIKMLKTLIRETGRKVSFTNWIFDRDTGLDIASYRSARIAAARQFKAYAGHKLYWSGGMPEGLALYDEFNSRGLKHGRDYLLITYGDSLSLKKLAGEELPHFHLSYAIPSSRLLCELILSQLENAVPRQLPIPTPFYPGNTLNRIFD
jgi:DNA-binding LacI/PurR family transcriptional regulator